MSDPNQQWTPPPPPPGAPPTTKLEGPEMSTPATLSGIFFEPGRTFEALRRRPRFLVVGLILLALTIGVTALVYQDAILNLDYERLGRRMRELASRMAERELRIRDPAGTDLSLRTGVRFHINDGDASKEKVAHAASARDREEEIPCGALRTIPLPDAVEGVIALRQGFGYPAVGYGLGIDQWLGHGLRFYFEKGRIRRVETDGDQAGLDRAWAAETGDKDRLGELVLGCNPLLKRIDGLAFPPYHGFGEAVLRLTIGENVESGGRYRSSLHRWLMFVEADISAGDDLIVSKGRLIAAAEA